MIHSDRNMIVLLHKTLQFFCTLQHLSKICSPFSCWLVTSNFFSVLIVLCQFFTLIGPGVVDLCFSLILTTKVSAFQSWTTTTVWLYHVISPYTWLGMTMTSLSASPLHKKNVAMDRVCLIALNRKLSCIVNAKSLLNWKFSCKFKK